MQKESTGLFFSGAAKKWKAPFLVLSFLSKNFMRGEKPWIKMLEHVVYSRACLQNLDLS